VQIVVASGLWKDYLKIMGEVVQATLFLLHRLLHEPALVDGSYEPVNNKVSVLQSILFRHTYILQISDDLWPGQIFLVLVHVFFGAGGIPGCRS
jgi:hypothetical protein